jgi:hypothetical protein
MAPYMHAPPRSPPPSSISFPTRLLCFVSLPAFRTDASAVTWSGLSARTLFLQSSSTVLYMCAHVCVLTCVSCSAAVRFLSSGRTQKSLQSRWGLALVQSKHRFRFRVRSSRVLRFLPKSKAVSDGFRATVLGRSREFGAPDRPAETATARRRFAPRLCTPFRARGWFWAPWVSLDGDRSEPMGCQSRQNN